MTYLWYLLAAIAEIAGCFSMFIVLRQGKSALWLIPGVVALLAFAYLLTKIESETAGRAYAAYGGIYILSAILWQWLVEKTSPDTWDLTGAVICVVGSVVIIMGPRTT